MESLEAGRAGNGMEAAGSRGGIFGLLRTISYFTYEMVDRQGKSPRRAILGNAGQMPVVSVPSGLKRLPHFISKI